MKRKNNSLKKVFYIYGVILLILFLTCITVYSIYTKRMKEATKQSLLATERIETLVPNNGVEDVSMQISKSIQEAMEEARKETLNNISENNTVETEEMPIVEKNVETSKPVEEVKPLEFMYPVEGAIEKGFAAEKLVFSETLQEWVTHNGIDIKAERTTIVKAVEEGKVIAIKNDPRYGITIIVEHREGYKSIYSNLLTTEFVAEGENVTKGQTLGTVGNSAVFEIADEPHLHFEMLKDEEYIDPTTELK